MKKRKTIKRGITTLFALLMCGFLQAQNQFYWTRGFSDTTSNEIWIQNGDDWFLNDRFVNAATNARSEFFNRYSVDASSSLGYVDSNGILTEDAFLSDSFKGSLYSGFPENPIGTNIHFGYDYSAYTGSGTTESFAVLNRDLTVNRVMVESSADMKTCGGITGDGTLNIMNYTSVENCFHVRPSDSSADSGFNFTLDVNVVAYTNTTQTFQQMFTVQTKNSVLNIGSATSSRTLTINQGTQTGQIYLFGFLYGGDAVNSSINVYSKIISDSSCELNFCGKATGIVNFLGSEDNTYNGVACVRYGIVNLMNRNGSSAFNMQRHGFYVAGGAYVNIFSEWQLSNVTTFTLCSVKNGAAGTINLNGTSLSFEAVSNTISGSETMRTAYIDFGMTDSGMDEKQFASNVEANLADGLAVDRTGKGKDQIFYVAGSIKEGSRLVFRNFYVGEDSVITSVKVEFDEYNLEANETIYFDVSHYEELFGTILEYGKDKDYYFTSNVIDDISSDYYGLYSNELVLNIPEPSTFALAIGTIALVLCVRRRK